MLKRKLIASSLILFTAFASMMSGFQTSVAAAEVKDGIAVHTADYDYYTMSKNSDGVYVKDQHKVYNNMSFVDGDNGKSIESTAVLYKFSELWQAGETWNTGIKLNEAILNENIQKSYSIAGARTSETEQAAYNDDITDQTYSMFDGLGKYRSAYVAGIGSTEDNTLNDQWSYDTSSELANIENLVKAVRNNNASTSPAKRYYSYARPFRWNLETGSLYGLDETTGLYSICQSQVAPSLLAAGKVKSNPADDGGFPSGHTNAAYLTSISLAYAVPEQYNDLLMRAAELGNNRIVAGMHSCLDVMGGRVAATAVATNYLYNDTEVKTAAYNTAQSKLVTDWTNTAATEADYSSYQSNLTKYIYYSTYNFTKTGDSDEEMRVPKGAEVLLETRYPYLSADQRRWVLYSTGLESGYPVLDDAEGWGRLNLYAAGNGYGAFNTSVTVDMNADLGGYSALDNWMNDISGIGGLTKTGTGTLVLAGNNSYSGATKINNGELVAANKNALGNSNITLENGTLSENVDGQVDINGNYTQKDGTLSLTVNSSDDVLNITGKAKLDGNLTISFEDNYVPAVGSYVVKFDSSAGSFDNATLTGLDSKYGVKVTSDGIVITDTSAKAQTDDTAKPTTSNTQTDESSSTAKTSTTDTVKKALKIKTKIASKITVKASSLKTKSKKISIGATAKNASKITYKITKGSNKNITVSKKGIIKIKKKAQKGTYKIQLKAVSDSTSYESATKTITIKIK